MKPINMGRCINFHSYHRSSQKRNVTRNMIKRGTTSSDSEFKEKNLEKLSEILEKK